MLFKAVVKLSAVIFVMTPAFFVLADEPVASDGSPTLLEREGWSAPDFFTDPGHQRFCQAIESGDTNAIDAAIRSGTDINFQGRDGITFLMWSYAANQIEAFRTLLNLGADPNKVMNLAVNSQDA